MGKYINEETGMDYWGGPSEYEKFYSIYEGDDGLFIVEESRVEPFSSRHLYNYIDSFDTREQAESALTDMLY